MAAEDNASRINHPFQDGRMNFTAFSRCLEYRREVAELMLEALPYLPERFTQVDIGAGNGLGTQVTKGMTEVFLRRAAVYGIDPDPYAIAQASKDTPSSERCEIAFIEGFGQDIETLVAGRIPKEGADMVSILDAVHEFPPDAQFPIIQAGARVLRPGGIFVMNSTFTSIATEENPAAWGFPAVKAALKFGGRKAKQPGLLQRPPEEYTQMLRNTGLEVIYYQVVGVTLPTSAMVAICQYPGFVEGVRKSFVFDNEPTLEQLSEELQIRYGKSRPLPRKWVRWIGQKPA
ncbi:class I SAM-dependent methyltransferase [Candidatus Daviesbacteria bacterium]|nr:class I SAM-dependent methyltransferase [Candidatus Daviesbacteria bacterium]